MTSLILIQVLFRTQNEVIAAERSQAEDDVGLNVPLT